MRFNRKTFFDSYRQKFGAMAQLQVDGLNFLLDKIESDPEWKSIPQISYFLATIMHETGITRGGVLQTFQPIKELRGREGTKIRRTQDRYWNSGAYGRGYVQITWPDNYRKFGLSEPKDYDKALEPETAYDIAARGMRKGMFTKFKLSDFVNGDVDYVGARQVVNGHDKALLIAGYAESFEDVLTGASKVEVIAEDVVKPPDGAKSGEPTPDVAAQKGEAIVGGRPEDPPKEVTKGSTPTKIAVGSGVLSAIGSSVWAYLKGNPNVAAIAIVCLTVLILAFVFRQIILDWARLQLGASPDKYNVK